MNQAIVRSLDLKKIIYNSLAIGMFVIAVSGSHQLFTVQDALAAEALCSRGDILLCEDWEALLGKDTSTGWGTWTPSAINAIAPNGVITGFGFNSNRSLRLSIAEYPCSVCAGDYRESGTAAKPFTPQSPTSSNKDIYMRWYIYYSPGFSFVPEGSGAKVAYLNSWLSGNSAWRTRISVEQDGSNTSRGVLQVDVMLPNGQPEDIEYRPNITKTPITSGVWHVIEVHLKMNTPGVANGEFDTWIDGVHNHHYTGKYINGPSSNPLNAMTFNAYFGGNQTSGTNHARQFVYYDNLVVSTHYIGPLGTISGQPAAPEGLAVQ